MVSKTKEIEHNIITSILENDESVNHFNNNKFM